LIFGLLLISCNTNPGKNPQEKIEFIVNKAYESGKFSGNVLVANKGKILCRKNFGMADNERGISASDSTKFLIASVSKPITAILILLNDPLSKYFNIESNPQVARVTVHHLLTHTSGIDELISKDHSFEESDLNKANVNFDSGSNFEYSNTGYVILKNIAEKVSKNNFQELIEQNICKKAELSSIGVTHNPNQLTNLANGYKTTSQSKLTEIGYPLSIIDGAGSLYATIDDLYKLDRALYTEKLLSKKSIELIQKQHVKGRFGYGWFLRERGGTWDIMYHQGDLPGYTSFISRRTKHDEVVILLSNVEGLDLSDLENDISKILKFDN